MGKTVVEIEQSLDRVARALRQAALALSDCEGDFDEVAYLDECGTTPEEVRAARAQAWETATGLLKRLDRVAGVMRIGGAGLIASKAKELEEECTAVINVMDRKHFEAWCSRRSPAAQRERGEIVDAAQC